MNHKLQLLNTSLHCSGRAINTHLLQQSSPCILVCKLLCTSNLRLYCSHNAVKVEVGMLLPEPAFTPLGCWISWTGNPLQNPCNCPTAQLDTLHHAPICTAATTLQPGIFLSSIAIACMDCHNRYLKYPNSARGIMSASHTTWCGTQRNAGQYVKCMVCCIA